MVEIRGTRASESTWRNLRRLATSLQLTGIEELHSQMESPDKSMRRFKRQSTTRTETLYYTNKYINKRSKSVAFCVGQSLLNAKPKPRRTLNSALQHAKSASKDVTNARIDQLPVKPAVSSELSAFVRQSPKHGSSKSALWQLIMPRPSV